MLVVKIINGYAWVAMIGFPLVLPFAVANRETWKHITGYRLGYKIGQMKAWTEATEKINTISGPH